jgi:hypothetical protein
MTAASIERDRVTRSHIRYLVRKAIKDGRLVKPDICSRCGAPDPEAHHPNYDRPLVVIWLCQAHHKAEHKRLRERARRMMGGAS